MERSGLLKGKKGIIFGALNETSLAWAIAKAAHREGAEFALSNAPVAKRLGTLDALAQQVGSPVLWADATKNSDIEAVFNELKNLYGKIDFMVHGIGMGINVRKRRTYDQLNHDWYAKSLDISAISLHRIVQLAMQTESLNHGGSILTISYIGAQRSFSHYSEMGDAKALLESIVRTWGAKLGEYGIRVNAISQSPTRTTAGQGISGFDAMFEFGEKMSPLGNADADSCGDYAVTLLSDLTRMVTMQTLYHDGGFSSIGITDTMIEPIMKMADQMDAKNK
ncbi:MAG: SDR family oxidoreductase [Bacteroidetes bacterium]|nr:SDR family oxidoreductase [Bacteroidota bacterium]MCY4233100.1 SDR family oxidoreductase [Bacteroidota bacterium]